MGRGHAHFMGQRNLPVNGQGQKRVNGQGQMQSTLISLDHYAAAMMHNVPMIVPPTPASSRVPVRLNCPSCGYEIITDTNFVFGCQTCIVFFVLLIT